MELFETIFYSNLSIFALISYYVATRFVLKTFEVKSMYLSTLVFIVVCTCSVGCMEMLVLEMLDVGTNETRAFQWKVVITCLNISSLQIIPGLLIFKTIFAQRFRYIVRLYILMLAGTLYQYSLVLLLMFEVSLNLKEEEYYNQWIWKKLALSCSPTMQFNVLSKAGICIISALSGFSAVNMPFFFFQYYDPAINNIIKVHIEDQIKLEWKNLIKEKHEMTKIYNPNFRKHMQKQPEDQEEKASVQFSTLFGKKATSYEKQIHCCESSSKIKTKMLNEIFLDYVEISREEKNRQMHKERTWWFLYQKILSYILIIYGIYKIVMTVVTQFILPRNTFFDPVTNIFRFMLRWFGWTLAPNIADLITHNICFVMIGFFIAQNIRSFGQTFYKFMNIFFSSMLSDYISVEFTLQICTQITAVYFISTFFGLLLNLPEKNRRNLVGYLDSIDYKGTLWVFDVVFVGSSIVFFIILWLNLKGKNLKYAMYAKKNSRIKKNS